MNFEIKGGRFWLNGRKVFLNAGEIHYFRIRRELWDTHLQEARSAGLTTVSTYVPWAWHEPEEGACDFDGTSCPEGDFQGWLQRCRAHGLTCIVKPGPFILAETRGAGLPDWFLSRHRQAVGMRNRKGEIVPSDGVSLFHPIFLEHVTRWYDHVMPLINRHEITSGGPIILMQMCNEIGVFSWLAHQADYAETVRARLHRVLVSDVQAYRRTQPSLGHGLFREELYYDKERLLANGDRWEREIAKSLELDAPYR